MTFFLTVLRKGAQNEDVEVHVLCFNVKKNQRMTYSWLLLRIGLSLEGNVRGKNKPVLMV